MTGWAWMILGMVLLCAELFAIDAQFYLVFLGLSAAVVGVLSMLGLDMPEFAQWMTFGVLSLISMFTFRKTLYLKFHGSSPGFKEGVNGEFIVLSEDLDAGQQGRVTFRGSDWTVVNDGTSTVKSGARIRVTRTEGLTLHVNTDSQ